MNGLKFESYPLTFSAACFGALLLLAILLRPGSFERVIMGVDKPLPRLKLSAEAQPLPDFTQYPQGKERKQAFAQFLAPLVQKANTHQLALREAALALASQQKINPQQQSWLNRLCKRYKIKGNCHPGASLVNKISLKLNTVPVALAIAQAAKESGWGTSRFAREGNNLFGQWCFKKGCGLVPKSRVEEASHEVTRFDSAQQAVASYLVNLNSHPAYQQLRLNRQQSLQQPLPERLKSLTEGLISYSERGQPYVDELRTMLRRNRSWQNYPEVTGAA